MNITQEAIFLMFMCLSAFIFGLYGTYRAIQENFRNDDCKTMEARPALRKL